MSNISTLPRVQNPTFETCIFGPKGIPVSIQPLGKMSDSERDSLIDITAKDLSDTLQKVELEMEENRNYKRTEQKLEQSLGLDSKKAHVDGWNDRSDVQPVSPDSLSTPPQSPMQSTRPLRPSKVLSTNKAKPVFSNVPISDTKNALVGNDKAHIINLQELRRLSSLGVPNDCSLRPIAWRVLLGYLPLDTSKWQAVLDRDRSLYRTLVQDLFCKSDDYPFEEEGKELVGKGLKYESDKVVSKTNDKLKNSLERVEDAMNDLKNKSIEVQDGVDESFGHKSIDSCLDDEIDLIDIPLSVREQWRKNGRSPESLWVGAGKGRLSRPSLEGHKRGISVSICQFNALLVSDFESSSSYAKTEEIDAILKNSSSHDEEDPKWKQFLENAALLDEIRKDVVRTHYDLRFFSETDDFKGIRRHAAIERILFVWAKLNKGVRYVQGMNEIVATLYFVLANDTENQEWAAEAEADVYFLFNTLMVEMRDIFVPDLDEADTGIQGRMANMIALLSLHDPEVRCHLDDCGIDPGFYSIRWLTTLLSREFSPADTIRLWDSMFASTHKDNFMRYVCVCMVMIIREDLLQGDFGTCLRLLQAYPSTDVEKLLESSRALWIYESQVTLACHKGGISLSQALTTIAPPPAVLMAYGLSGGLALDQIELMRQAAVQNISKQKTRFKGGVGHMNMNQTTATAGKSFFAFFGHKK